ncbi:DUF1905 domain-containing protein [Clostridium sp. YIM B02515]|uniref:DUF1905 domain-containing protein n=1 Tax=Clostridium rhizosphaerae TaxID=2803861 RepID=A0ABS1TH63_9CLOT|nr:YdeI/OmpD-associated family protein [Clostridium rhizosphaerae]MBL4937684.1 DUF1905 domain-containing protein [Clostridium rhizosphaerae]
MNIYEFDAVIKKHDEMDAAFIEFPFDAEKEFKTKGQVKVKASFDGYQYRGSLAKMGHYCHCIGITQKIRKEISKQAGDSVHVIIEKDDEPRVVQLPEDFKKVLEESKKAKEFFYCLSYTNQKKYIEWITNAKKIDTREKRIEESIKLLNDGVKCP